MWRHLRNHLLYGSCAGPSVVIDWERGEISFRCMSARRVIRLMRWVGQGRLEQLDEMESGDGRAS